MHNDILELFAKRHSFYDINDNSPLGEENITNLIRRSVELYPSPFNSQSARVVALYNDNHKKFWALTEKKLLEVSPQEKHAAISDKIAGFAKGFGTILYYTDTTVTKALAQRFPLYAEKFENWAFQCNAILQFMIWTALADSGIGANLQHYNPLVDEETAALFDIPQNWELVAQMPFGGTTSTPQPHEVENLKDILVIKK